MDENDSNLIVELKEKGNKCIKEHDYKQAIKFYSDALRVSNSLNCQESHILFSNRSFAYLKNKNFYYALADAERCIELKPEFVKGTIFLMLASKIMNKLFNTFER